MSESETQPSIRRELAGDLPGTPGHRHLGTCLQTGGSPRDPHPWHTQRCQKDNGQQAGKKARRLGDGWLEGVAAPGVLGMDWVRVIDSFNERQEVGGGAPKAARSPGAGKGEPGETCWLRAG